MGCAGRDCGQKRVEDVVDREYEVEFSSDAQTLVSQTIQYLSTLRHGIFSVVRTPSWKPCSEKPGRICLDSALGGSSSDNGLTIQPSDARRAESRAPRMAVAPSQLAVTR